MAMRFSGWRNTIDWIRENRGSMLPFLAVMILLMVLVAAFSLGSTKLYQDRSLVRDALDAAAAASLAPTESLEKKYRFGSRLVSSGPGSPPVCRSFTETLPVVAEVNKVQAEALAREYFHANLQAHGLRYEILDLQMQIFYESRILTVEEYSCAGGLVNQWKENSPRWVRVSIEAKVKMPVQMGKTLEMTEITTTVKSQYKKRL